MNAALRQEMWEANLALCEMALARALAMRGTPSHYDNVAVEKLVKQAQAAVQVAESILLRATQKAEAEWHLLHAKAA